MATNSMNGVVITELTANAKLGAGISSTMVAQQSCPNSCPFKGSGCYAESGIMGMHTRQLNKAQLSADELIQNEANGIRAMRNKHTPLRLHVVGDVTTNEQAQLLASATKGRSAPVWTYSHAWRDIDPDSFGSISVLASCETPELVRMAQDKGYATAIVTDVFPTDKAYELDGITVIPCPEQTRGKTCSECRLCMNAEHLRKKRLTIGFAAHGSRFKTVLKQVGASTDRRRFYEGDALNKPILQSA